VDLKSTRYAVVPIKTLLQRVALLAPNEEWALAVLASHSHFPSKEMTELELANLQVHWYELAVKALLWGKKNPGVAPELQKLQYRISARYLGEHAPQAGKRNN
jgi:hypothetical protein